MTLISDFVEQNHDVSLLSVDLFEWLCTKRQLFLKSQNWKGFALVRYQNMKMENLLLILPLFHIHMTNTEKKVF